MAVTRGHGKGANRAGSAPLAILHALSDLAHRRQLGPPANLPAMDWFGIIVGLGLLVLFAAVIAKVVERYKREQSQREWSYRPPGSAG